MCGIFGAICKQADQAVFTGLKKLEYRGYDSWGIGVLVNSALQLEKHVGKISLIEELDVSSSEVALGHTRWATHGGVTEKNAHPHLAKDQGFILVQNGVVENMEELRNTLELQGETFTTNTDTEVILRLIEHKIKKEKVALNYQIFAECMQQIEGRNSVAILLKTGEIMAIRFGSPLVVGWDEIKNEYYLSSDISSLPSVVKKCVHLNAGEGVVMSGHSITFYPLQNDQKNETLKTSEISWQIRTNQSSQAELGDYHHFMEKEIYEQPKSLGQMFENFKKDAANIKEIISTKQRIFTLGIGSAGYAAAQLAWYLRTAGIMCQAIQANETSSYKSILKSGDMVIAISQSGETADVIEAVEWMKEKGVCIMSLVNSFSSSLEQLSDHTFYLGVGTEVGVASTKALTAQLAWGKCVSWLVMKKGPSIKNIEQSLQQYCFELEQWLKTINRDSDWVKEISKLEHLFFLGRGELLISAYESALKMKEISYLHAEGLSGGELKHGPLALIESGTLVIVLVAPDEEEKAQQNAIAEIKARGGKVIGVAVKPDVRFDFHVSVCRDQSFASVSYVIPFQLCAYYLAIKSGYDPDKPRNLAKSVTVK